MSGSRSEPSPDKAARVAAAAPAGAVPDLPPAARAASHRCAAARRWPLACNPDRRPGCAHADGVGFARAAPRSEEHTSELQSQSNLVCRLLLEKKKKKRTQSKYIVHHPSNMTT